MKIIYDVMGGDNAPLEIIKGALKSKNELGIDVVLVGEKTKIEAVLAELNMDSNAIEIVNATEVIENDEEPAMAIRKKKDSSIVVGLKYLAEGKGDGFISAGNTGAVLAGGMFIVKRLDNIQRTPIGTLMPTMGNSCLLIDAGANVDTTPELLNQFAYMGSVYMSEVLERPNPTVGLLNIGKEKGKGNNLYKATYELLENNENINFQGNFEGREVPFGTVDILVADGFDGNVFLKTYEGTSMMILEILKGNIKKETDMEKAMLLKGFLGKSFATLDYRLTGGAPLLGLNKPVVKAHGSSDELSIFGATKQMMLYIENNVIEKMKENL